MSEQTQNPTDEANPADEMAALKQRAQLMGITFHPNIGIDKLRDKVNARLTGMTDTNADEEDEMADASDEPAQKEDKAPVVPVTPVARVRAKTKAEKEQDLRSHLMKESNALVRCRIFNLNPMKRDLKGEIITVANKYIGKVSKFIPFGEETEKGYHIPKILFDDLKQRQFLELRSREVNGKTQLTRRMVPEYNIEVLQQLTREELAELALKQEAAARLEG